MRGKELRLGHHPRQTTRTLLKKHFQQEAERGNNTRKSNEKQPETKKKKKESRQKQTKLKGEKLLLPNPLKRRFSSSDPKICHRLNRRKDILLPNFTHLLLRAVDNPVTPTPDCLPRNHKDCTSFIYHITLVMKIDKSCFQHLSGKILDAGEHLPVIV